MPSKNAPPPAPPSYCAECGRERLPREHACPVCACDLVLPDAPGFGVARGRAWTVGGPLGELVRIGPDRILLLHGEPSAGKTSIALAAFGSPLSAGELRHAGRKVPAPVEREPHGRRAWLCTSEMGGELVGDYASRLGYRPERVSVLPPLDGRRPTNGEEAGLSLGIGRDYLGCDLILDSITEAPDPSEVIRVVRLYVREFGVRACVIAQDTKDGDVRGSRTLTYRVDVIATILRFPHWRALVVGPKNRGEGGSGGVLFDVDDRPDGTGRIGRPRWGSAYFVVDGKRPFYRLVPWPSPEVGSLADPLRDAERGKITLPAAPVAVAASRSRLHPSGWAEPADVDARRAFVERAGLSFAGPLDFGPPKPSESALGNADHA